MKKITITILFFFISLEIYAADITAGTSNYDVTETHAGGTAFSTTDNLLFNQPTTYTLTSNVQCADLTLDGSVQINMNGYTLTVMGNLNVTDFNSKQIDLGNEGQLIVSGDAFLGSSCGITGTGACLFQIGGSLSMSDWNNTYITSGTLKIGGDIAIGSSNIITVGTFEMNGCIQNMDVKSDFSVSKFIQSSTCTTTISRSGGTSTITVDVYDQNGNSTNIKPLTNFIITGETINTTTRKYWDGGGADNNWTTAENWSDDTAPLGGEDLIFSGTTGTTPFNDFAEGTSFNSISFSDGATSFTLSGNGIVLEGGSTAIFANNTSNTMAINNNITFSILAPTISLAHGGTLLLNGNIFNDGLDITYDIEGNTTVSGGIDGTGELIKLGNGELILSGTNTYSGNTTISAGTLQIGNSSTTGTLPGNVLNNSTLIFNRSDSYGYTGIISGSGNLIQNGAGVITISGANTYTGTTTIAASRIIKVGNNTALGDVAGEIVLMAGNPATSLYINSGVSVSGKSLIMNSNITGNLQSSLFVSFGTATWDGTITLAGTGRCNFWATNGYVLNLNGEVNGNCGSLYLTGAASGSPGLGYMNAELSIGTTSVVKDLLGTWTITSTSNRTGTTKIQNGTLIINTTTSLGTGDVELNGGTLSVQIDGVGNDSEIDFNNDLIIYTNNSSSLHVGNNGSNTGNTISFGSFNIGANSTLNVSGANDYNVQFSSLDLLGYTGGSSTINPTTTNVFIGSVTTNDELHTLVLDGTSTGNIISGIISNDIEILSLNKTNTSIWTLQAANTYTGTTNINGGTLKLGINNAIHEASAITINSPGILDLNSYTQSVGSIAGNGIIDNVSNAGTPILTIGNDNSDTEFSGVIKNTTGSLSIIKTGTGTLSLSGNNSFSGDISFPSTPGNHGKISLTHNSALGTGVKTIYMPGNNASIQEIQLSNNIIISNINIQTASRNAPSKFITNLSGDNTWNGDITITEKGGDAFIESVSGSITIGGTIQNSHSAPLSLDLKGNGDFIINGNIVDGSDTLEINKYGLGTLTLSGNNSYSGTTTINEGILKLGSNTALGAINLGTIINSGAALDLNGQTYSNAETLTISDQGYLSSGVIFNNNFTEASFAGSILLSGASTINTNNQITLSGNIINSENFTKTGTNNLIFTNNTVSVNDFLISEGNINAGSSTINITGDFINNGTFSANSGSISLNSSSSQSINSATFNNLIINNHADVILTDDIIIQGTLTLTSGILKTDIHSIDLETTGTLIETPINPTSYILGKIKATRPLMTDVNNSFGGIGLELTETITNNNLTEVIRVTGVPCVGIDNNESILRYFTITPDTKEGLNTTMRFHYYDHEFVGHEEGLLDIYKSTDNQVSWSRFQPTRDTDNNILTLSNITSFSDWTASDGENLSLPIVLVDFIAFAYDSGIELIWETASEYNNNFFAVERSQNSINWDSVTTINSKGNSSYLRNYSFFDNFTINDIVYYRLKQTDFDGKFSYSKVISVNGNIDIMNNIDIKYISRKKLINIHCDEQTQKNIELIEILGGNGQTEYRSYKYQSQISTENIANGIYFLYCKQKYNETIIKFVID